MKRRIAAAVLAAATHAAAQTVTGQAFDDRNGNGLKDPGEPALPSCGEAADVRGEHDPPGVHGDRHPHRLGDRVATAYHQITAARAQ